MAAESTPWTSRAADEDDDGHADGAAGHGGDDEGGDEADAAVGEELAGWAALLLTDEGTVIATGAAFPSALNRF